MPRLRKLDRPVQWRALIPTSLAKEVEMFLLDPLDMEVKYSAKSKLTELLLREWLVKKRGVASTPATVDNTITPSSTYHDAGKN